MHSRWTLAATLALVTAGGSALAQPKRAEIEAAKKEAIAVADKGVEAFRTEKYQAAIEAFTAADKKFHVPKFLLYVARSQVKLGKLLEGKTTYQSIVDEKLPPYAPEEFFTAQSDAKKEMVDLETRIPTVRIEVNGALEGQAPVVTLDGVVLPKADLGRPLPRNPGPHAIVVTAPGRPQLSRTVNLRESGSESVILEMGVTALPTATAGAPSATAAPSASVAPSASGGGEVDKPSGGGGIPTLTIAAYAVGAAGLAAGAVFGGLTLGKHQEYNQAPTREALDQGRMFGLITDIGFGTAIAGAAVGTVYWLVSRPKSDTAAKTAKGSLVVAPSVSSGAGGVWVSGRF